MMESEFSSYGVTLNEVHHFDTTRVDDKFDRYGL
jgi:hypothetical protein